MGLNIVDINVFLFNVYKRFFNFCHVFTLFNVFSNVFLHLWVNLRSASVSVKIRNALRSVVPEQTMV